MMQSTPQPINHPMPNKRWVPERIPSQAEMLARDADKLLRAIHGAMDP